mmetsp:Transcript_7645/g.11117  ORF Transcript_7645/g.11117 Transcript_7645/m.11117 type:complete len:274 (-) Transcript_7645:285-1106(-)|eukprot:CAMPEP_0195512938 /NCGR_PEP_ID=MMETSP0794_2-20130614/4724_1 /TAXON_ID=515487 /ORGANISM="Stephanopyxis turris, Strain CCMP 815" /LENGTH=273 /DNA_ID=CAMNT_0040640835 /DNA_START=56 /DNA_END=877 /DNA_ORIENTATION=-
MAMPPVREHDIDGLINEVWSDSRKEIEQIDAATQNWKAQVLPLARIKKIMKSEEPIYPEQDRDTTGSSASSSGTTGQRFMIAGEAPVMLGKACELLIRDLTTRAWWHTQNNRRRTLQRQDIHAGACDSDVYDFLIDFIPRINHAGGVEGSGVQQPCSATTVSEQCVTGKNVTSSLAMEEGAAVPTGQIPNTGMSIAEAQLRLAHLQQIQQQFALQRQQMQDAAAAGSANVISGGQLVQEQRGTGNITMLAQPQTQQQFHSTPDSNTVNKDSLV